MMKERIELPHVDKDGYKVGAEYTFLVLNNRLERVPLRLWVELEWVQDDEYEGDSFYLARLITSRGNKFSFKVDDEDGEGADSEGGEYFIKSLFFSELRDQDTADDFSCGFFDAYLDLSINRSRGTVSLHLSLCQIVDHKPVL